MSRPIILAVILCFGLSFAAAMAQAPGPAPTAPKRAAEFELKGAVIELFTAKPTGGHIRFKQGGKARTADLSQARVYVTKGGKKKSVPKAEWKNVFKKGAKADLYLRLTETDLLMVAVARMQS